MDRFPELGWPGPISVEEARELARRANLQALKGPAVHFAARQPGYAGMYTDNRRGGVMVFQFTVPPSTTEELVALAPSGAVVEVRAVERSYSDLLSIKASLLAARSDLASTGIAINSVGIRPQENSVHVGLATRDPSSEAALLATFGPGLVFSERGLGQFDACTADENCWPPKGGFDVTADDMPTAECTSGFLVKRSDISNTRQILTAGHCLAKAGGVGEIWTHDDNGPSIGTAQTNTFAEHPVLGGIHDTDVGLIGISTGISVPTKNQFIAGLSGSTPILASVTNYSTYQNQNVGDQVCRFGITSNRDCGYIIEEEAENISCLGQNDTNCKDIQRTWVVDFDSCGGDSGGPVFLYSYPPASVNRAYGTHVHSTLGCSETSGDSWYSPYDLGRNEWNEIHPTILYFICLSATCP